MRSNLDHIPEASQSAGDAASCADLQHRPPRAGLRSAGRCLLSCGVIFTGCGVWSFFASFPAPHDAWLAYVGLPVLALGVCCCAFAGRATQAKPGPGVSLRRVFGTLGAIGLVCVAFTFRSTVLRSRGSSDSNACGSNLRQIDGATQQYVWSEGLYEGDPVPLEGISRFLHSNALPQCPRRRAEYVLPPVGQKPYCTYHRDLSELVLKDRQVPKRGPDEIVVRDGKRYLLRKSRAKGQPHRLKAVPDDSGSSGTAGGRRKGHVPQTRDCALLAQAPLRRGRDIPTGMPTAAAERLCIQDSSNICRRYLRDRTLA